MRAVRQRQTGFTYLGLLLAVVVLSILLAEAGVVWHTQIRRDREAELLYVGAQYRTAIGRYLAAGGSYPQSLDQLVNDERAPQPRHFLRRLYPDPMTGAVDWQLIESPANGGIMGIASSSQAAPIKVAGFDDDDIAFEHSQCYCQWQFIYTGRRFRWYQPPTVLPSGGAGGSSGGS